MGRSGLPSRDLAWAACAAALFAVGVTGGRWTASERGEPSAAVSPGGRVATTTPAATGASSGWTPAGDPTPVRASEPAEARPAPPPVATQDAAVGEVAGGLDDEPGCAGEHDHAADGPEALLTDPHALAVALVSFQQVVDAERLESLAAALGRVRDPSVEEAALRVAATDADPARRAAAFDLLDGLDTPAARELALDALDGEADVRVRRAALHAIPAPVGASEGDAERVLATAARVLQRDGDPETRRRAALVIGRWRRSAADLAPVTHGLGSDPVGAVRAGCAFALELAGDRSAASQAALVAALDDVDPFVGETAWRALGSLGPLQAGTGRAWAGAAERFDGLGEGTD